MTKKLSYLALSLLMLFFLVPTMAHADVALTPVRVVFEGRDRSAIVQLINLTDRTNTYRIGWLALKMDDNGKYIQAPVTDNKDPYSVPSMVMFSPRQVVLAPHGQQTVRLSLRRPADLPPGEYRAHMSLIRIAHEDAPDPDSKGVSIELKVNLGFSIPIIVRSGEDKDLKVTLASPKMEMVGPPENQKPVLNIDIKRISGKFSTYGYLQVFWKDASGKEKEIAKMANVAVYPELESRHMVIPLTEAPTNGSMRVVYMGKYESDGVKWAEQTFPIGK